MTKQKPWDNGPLQVQENGRYFQNGTEPFFWLGDTAWLLFQNLTLEETYQYLQNRRDKGFNVIQATIIHQLPGSQRTKTGEVIPRRDASLAFYDMDMSRPNLETEFWGHIDEVVRMTEELGMYIAFVPCWGTVVDAGCLTLNNVSPYATFLGERYKDNKNIIWLIGGDCRGDKNYELWSCFGSTIKALCKDHMVTFHPFGRTSSTEWFHNEDWMDFNMFQAGHRRYDQACLGAWDDNAHKEGFFGEDSWRYVARDYSYSPVKPTLDGEPSYEQIPQGLHGQIEPFWQAEDVRRFAYWSVFAGAAGHTYGHNAIFQFHHPDSMPLFNVKMSWQDAMHDAGSNQMQILKSLMEAVDFGTGKLADELLYGRAGDKYERIAAFAGEDFAYFYSYLGTTFIVKLESLNWERANAWWFDPTNGTYSFIGTYEEELLVWFAPPQKRREHNDWVLVLKKA
jgi:hypothetical protein